MNSIAKPFELPGVQKRLYTGDKLRGPRRLFHYCYTIARAAEDEQAFDRRLLALKRELEIDKRVPEHENLYQMYFTLKTTPKRGTRAKVREEVVRQNKRYYLKLFFHVEIISTCSFPFEFVPAEFLLEPKVIALNPIRINERYTHPCSNRSKYSLARSCFPALYA